MLSITSKLLLSMSTCLTNMVLVDPTDCFRWISRGTDGRTELRITTMPQDNDGVPIASERCKRRHTFNYIYNYANNIRLINESRAARAHWSRNWGSINYGHNEKNKVSTCIDPHIMVIWAKLYKLATNNRYLAYTVIFIMWRWNNRLLYLHDI